MTFVSKKAPKRRSDVVAMYAKARTYFERKNWAMQAWPWAPGGRKRPLAPPEKPFELSFWNFPADLFIFLVEKGVFLDEDVSL